MSKFHVLIDSDAFVGLKLPDDSLHAPASEAFEHLIEQEKRLVTTSLVVAETATVLSHKANQEAACQFLEEIEAVKFPIIHITKGLQQVALRIFREQFRRGTSVTDCANVAVLRQLTIPHILSFDRVYSKDFGIEPLAIAG